MLHDDLLMMIMVAGSSRLLLSNSAPVFVPLSCMCTSWGDANPLEDIMNN